MGFDKLDLQQSSSAVSQIIEDIYYTQKKKNYVSEIKLNVPLLKRKYDTAMLTRRVKIITSGVL